MYVQCERRNAVAMGMFLSIPHEGLATRRFVKESQGVAGPCNVSRISPWPYVGALVLTSMQPPRSMICPLSSVSFVVVTRRF